MVGRLEAAVQFVQWLSASIAAASIAGCASLWAPDAIRTRDGEVLALPVWTTDGMYLVTGRSGALFVTPSALDLSRYRGVVLDEIRISAKPGARVPKPNEEKRLSGYFLRRLEHAFARNGWSIVDAPGPDVIHARLLVKDLDLGRGRRSHHGKVVSNLSAEAITIVLELRDPTERDRRLVFAVVRRLPFGVYSGSDAVSVRRVEDAFYDFSIDVRRRLREVLNGDFPPPTRPSSDFAPTENARTGWLAIGRTAQTPQQSASVSPTRS
jgi:hypothetical protein